MGKVIPFPLNKQVSSHCEERGEELTDTIIRKKILAGEAELVGEFDEEGRPCACYKLEFDHQTYYIFDLSSFKNN